MIDDDLIARLRATRATLVAHSPQDRAVRDAIAELERGHTAESEASPTPDGESVHSGGRRFQRFNGRWMVQPPMLRGWVPVDPAFGDLLDEVTRLRRDAAGTASAASGGASSQAPAPIPRISDEERQYVTDATTLFDALWELSEIYRVPLTNNTPFFEESDPAKPVYHVGDWVGDLQEVFARFSRHDAPQVEIERLTPRSCLTCAHGCDADERGVTCNWLGIVFKPDHYCAKWEEAGRG